MRHRKPSKQTRKVLEYLLQCWPEKSYGYELIREIGLKSGTLYPILMRLTEQGWLAAQWESKYEPGRPPRHLYSLTPEGKQVAIGLSISESLPASCTEGAS